MNKRWIAAISLAVLALTSVVGVRHAAAQVTPRAKLIWLDEGDPTRSSPTATRYFRGTFTEEREVTEAELHMAGDDEFVLFVNGQQGGRSDRWQDGKVIDLKPFLRRGRNVLAVRATNHGGPAALVAWLVYTTNFGEQESFLTDAGWKCFPEAPKAWREVEFDDSTWDAVKVIGEFGKIGPWPPVAWNDGQASGGKANGGKADPGRFRVPPGFTIDVAAEPELTGSIVCMTLDAFGRPIIAQENGPVFILEDTDGDGRFVKATVLTHNVTNCQGLLAYDATTYYMVGQGPEGAGVYRLKHTQDGEAHEVRLIHAFRGGMSEHGPHAVVAGPDGYLYLACGNMASASATPEANSPVEKQYEADVLPRYEDPTGHAAGVKVPGGAIWRFDPEGRHFTLEAAGFRNHYDLAFNSLGEAFTFDSDMELQEYLPFYVPVRVCHCPPGAEFGWRSNSAKWPPYFVDALPPTLDIGRGSPTGIVFYNHHQFPPEYHDALLMGDWSNGRIFSVKFRRDGATFTAEAEEFVTGKPLNVVDLEVAPDGSVLFASGGRGTQGGLYRIRSTQAAPGPSALFNSKALPKPKGAAAVQAALDQPQPQSAWGREAIRRFKKLASDRWQTGLETAAKDGDAPAAQRIRALTYLVQFGPEPSLKLARRLARDGDAEVRAQAAVVLARRASAEVGSDLVAMLGDRAPIVQRRAAEGLVRTGTLAPFDKLRPLLAGADRFARFAARLALERTDPAEWRGVSVSGLRGAVLNDENPRVAIMGLIALNKLGVVATDAKVAEAAFVKELSLLKVDLDPEDLLDTLRCLELTLVNTRPESRPESVETIGAAVLARFPSGERSLDYELARVLAALGVPGGIDPLLAALEKQSATETLEARANAIHYARCLAAMTEGWAPTQRLRFLGWFNVAKDWHGGHSYRGYIHYFLRDALAQLTPADQEALVREAEKTPGAVARAVERLRGRSGAAFAAALTARLQPGDTVPIAPSDGGKQTPGWTYEQLLEYVEGEGRGGSLEAGRKIFAKANCAKCHRFQEIGGGLGPDLTALSSRFRRKEVLESIVDSSRVIGDQYKSWLITTSDGRTIHAMKAPDEGDQLVLVLSDARFVKLPKADVEEMVESKRSTMPDGLLNPFSLREVADLLAFLESGKPPAAKAAGSDRDGFRPLFNGKDLDGWVATRQELWSVRDGMIVGKVQRGQIQANTFLANEETFSDFVLRASVRLVKGQGNSGLQFRTRMLPGGQAKGYQADAGQGFWGLLLEESGRGILKWPDPETVEQRGFVSSDEWNQYVITAKGRRITLELNGFECVDLDDEQGDLSGVIAMQLHAGETMEVQFKDIAIKESP